MQPTPLVHALMVLLPLSLSLLVCRTGDDASFARRGPWPVGTREAVIPEGPGVPSLPATLWYPAVKPPGAREEIIYLGATEGIGALGQSAPIKGRALADAAPGRASGAFPVVVFVSNRNRGRMLYAATLEQLASHGFLVIAIGPMIGPSDPLKLSQAVIQVIGFAGTLARSEGPFRGLVDAARVAVMGHGDGASAALLACGARMDAPARAAPPSQGVSRARALILLGAGGEQEAPLDFSALALPVLILAGSRGAGRPNQGAERLYQRLPSARKAKLVFVGGGPDLFCVAREDIAVATDVAGLDAGLWDARHAHRLIHQVATAFLRAVLEGDAEARKALRPGAVSAPRTEFTSTWQEAPEPFTPQFFPRSSP